jgi:hypothetical protein
MSDESEKHAYMPGDPAIQKMLDEEARTDSRGIHFDPEALAVDAEAPPAVRGETRDDAEVDEVADGDTAPSE